MSAINHLGFLPAKLPSVLILAPCYVASYGPARDSVGNFMAVYTEQGGHVRIKSAWRSSNPSEVRTLCVEHHAIPSNFDMVLWVDDDNCFSPDDARAVIRASHNMKSIVSANYVSRSENSQPIAGPTVAEDEELAGLRSVEWVGFGLTAMPMALVRIMWERYGYDMFRDPRPTAPTMTKEERAALKAEDVAFCRHWRLLGHKVYVHSRIHIGHIGLMIFRPQPENV